MENENWLARLVVAGTPKPQPRPRFVNGRVVASIDPAVRSWQAAVQRAALEAAGGCSVRGRKRGRSGSGGAGGDGGVLSGVTALRVDCEFWFGTGKSERWGRPHTFRPDRDNLDKLVLDELVRVGWLGGDDCRVSVGEISKWWCPPGEECAVVTVWDAGELRRQWPGSSAGGTENPPDWLFGKTESGFGISG